MRVYKFLDKKYGLEALKKRRLKIARINELNDPFELLGVDLSDKKIRKGFLEFKNTTDKRYGLLCFSKSWRNPLLWSHYSDKHRGLCLGFDIADNLLINVNYTKKRTTSELLFSDDQMVNEDGMQRLLSTKFSHWKYENEVRCFYRLEDKDLRNGLYFSDFSNTMEIKEVLVGPDSRVSRRDVEKALGSENAHVKRFKTRAAFKTFRVVQTRKISSWA